MFVVGDVGHSKESVGG